MAEREWLALGGLIGEWLLPGLYLPLNWYFQAVQYQALCFHLNTGG
jgi:hypothetical protein